MAPNSSGAALVRGDRAAPWREVVLRLHERDNVAIARTDLVAGLRLDLDVGAGVPARKVVTLPREIPSGHKMALRAIRAGEPVLRYGQVIGSALEAIQPGDHVHVHNVVLDDVAREAAGGPFRPPPPLPGAEQRSFLGFRRPVRSAGPFDVTRAGTRNYVAVISTVNCSAHTCRAIARHFSAGRLAPYPNVDGVIALTHGSGCPIKYPILQRTLAGMACHPNVGAYLLVGLGCETNQVAGMVERHTLRGENARSLVIQDQGGIRATVAAGIAAVEELLAVANAARREPMPLSGLSLALQCGGSDGWSGVTANPLVGRVADEIVRRGGTVVLAETPEIYGAEHLLAGRALNAQVAADLKAHVAWWCSYSREMGFDLDDNRAVGNETGGLTTIHEKSLGAAAKAGSSPLVAVYDYAQPVVERGFCFMNTPGFDPVAVTGQVAGGCNLVLFTTGRGSVFGFKPSPCIKISSNSALYRRLPEDMDLDAGRVLANEELDSVALELLDLVVAVASGRPTKSEALGVGEAEFCPWNREGVL